MRAVQEHWGLGHAESALSSLVHGMDNGHGQMACSPRSDVSIMIIFYGLHLSIRPVAIAIGSP